MKATPAVRVAKTTPASEGSEGSEGQQLGSDQSYDQTAQRRTVKIMSYRPSKNTFYAAW